jgi:hypothetical protein
MPELTIADIGRAEVDWLKCRYEYRPTCEC